MAELKEFKCPACGGAVFFDPTVQTLKCPFCQTELEISALEAYNEQLADEIQEDLTWQTDETQEWLPGETEGMRVYTCKSCGGEIIGDENTGATTCPYCGNPVVMTGQFKGDLRPEWVIPFKKTKEDAKATFRKHLEGKKLLPRVFKDEHHIDEIKGIYVPFWLFDADVDTYIRYKATRTRTWMDAKYNYVETSYYSVQRAGDISFEHVPADGSSRIDDTMMESIEPFDFSEAVDFRTAYLAGFFADKYNVPAIDQKDRIDARVRASTSEAFNSTIAGYSSIIPEATSIRYRNSSAHYALYPVWLLNTTWQGEQYMFAMNGQTGKFIGDLPVDKGIYYRYLIMITAIVGALVYGLMWMF